MESLKELYRIGPGPSSSHTLAVKNACLYYYQKYLSYDKFVVDLYGSLALTGRGHMTEKVIESVFGADNVTINYINEYRDNQPNTMIFYCLQQANKVNEMTIYSTGGGAIEIKGQPSLVDKHVFVHESMKEIMDYCQQNHLSLAEYVYKFDVDIKPHLFTVLQQMLEVVNSGLHQQGLIPGSLKLPKVAKNIYQKSLDATDPIEQRNLLVTAYAYSAMEENASGNIVVTAPTLGSCGVVSALVSYYYNKGVSKERLVNALATAGIFGNLVKTNASISGAVGGCQAEIGTACAMGAALCSYIEGLSNYQIEYASEVAMEHNLGLTCDPIGGYVQVPCIERNGVAALRSLDCMLYAKYIGEIKQNIVSFDSIVKVMNYTGQKIPMELKETSLGGLATIMAQRKDSND